MQFSSLIEKLLGGQALQESEMQNVMRALMSGESDPIQAAALLTALRAKGETPQELAAAARTMLEFAVPLEMQSDKLIDTCGTGGDNAHTFNISTAAALAAAAAGAVVAKHGNRSVSSHCGSADCLELAGVKIDLSATAVRQCIEKIGIGFLFAPNFHPAMRHLAGIRKTMGIRTIFNLLGPLTNPAKASARVIGVFDQSWLKPMAQTAAALGVKRVMTVCSDDGLDEISIASKTQVVEISGEQIRAYTVSPKDFGYTSASLSDIKTASAEESVSLLRSALSGNDTPASQAIAINAGAALYIAGLASGLASGATLAMQTMRDGKAVEKLQALVETSNALANHDG